MKTTDPALEHASAHPDANTSLLLRLRQGDPEAGEQLTRLYREPMLRLCRAYLGATTDVEDAVQEIFLKVLRSDVLPDHFRTWIYRIGRNQCLELLRRQRRRRDDRPLAPESQLHSPHSGATTRLAREERHERLARLLQALNLEHREVLHLRYVEQLTRAEVAGVLELSESLVKSRLYEGLKRLREHSSLRES